MRALVSNYFPNKTHLVTFDNTLPFGYVEKFNFVKLISQETKYNLFLEEDWNSIAPLKLGDHLNYLDVHPEVDQLILSEHFWLQDEESKQKTSINDKYWDHSKVDLFRHKSLGVVINLKPRPIIEIEELLFSFEKAFSKKITSKESIVKIMKDFLVNFEHKEVGKTLDSKM